MASEWYYARDGQPMGPVSSAQLTQLAADGVLQPTDLVWKEGLAQWFQASSIKGLFANIALMASRTAVPNWLADVQRAEQTPTASSSVPNWITGLHTAEERPVLAKPPAPSGPLSLAPEVPKELASGALLGQSQRTRVPAIGVLVAIVLIAAVGIGAIMLSWSREAGKEEELQQQSRQSSRAMPQLNSATKAVPRLSSTTKTTIPHVIDSNSLESTSEWVKDVWARVMKADASRNDLQIQMALEDADKALGQLAGIQVRWKLQVSSVYKQRVRKFGEEKDEYFIRFSPPPCVRDRRHILGDDRDVVVFSLYLSDTNEPTITRSHPPYELPLIVSDKEMARTLSQGRWVTLTGRVHSCRLAKAPDEHAGATCGPVLARLIDVKVVE
jgi:GYF domain 2